MSLVNKIKFPDIANGPGCRVSLYISGCPHQCSGCFNPETWDPDKGDPGEEKIKELESILALPHCDGLSLLGGEPLVDYNLQFSWECVNRAKVVNKTVWVWTGYTMQELRDFLQDNTYCERSSLFNILSMADMLIDGQYQAEQSIDNLTYRGSTNQNIYTQAEIHNFLCGGTSL